MHQLIRGKRRFSSVLLLALIITSAAYLSVEQKNYKALAQVNSITANYVFVNSSYKFDAGTLNPYPNINTVYPNLLGLGITTDGNKLYIIGRVNDSALQIVDPDTGALIDKVSGDINDQIKGNKITTDGQHVYIAWDGSTGLPHDSWLCQWPMNLDISHRVCKDPGVSIEAMDSDGQYLYIMHRNVKDGTIDATDLGAKLIVYDASDEDSSNWKIVKSFSGNLSGKADGVDNNNIPWATMHSGGITVDTDYIYTSNNNPGNEWEGTNSLFCKWKKDLQPFNLTGTPKYYALCKNKFTLNGSDFDDANGLATSGQGIVYATDSYQESPHWPDLAKLDMSSIDINSYSTDWHIEAYPPDTGTTYGGAGLTIYHFLTPPTSSPNSDSRKIYIKVEWLERGVTKEVNYSTLLENYIKP